MKLITRSGCKRIAILGAVLGVFILWAWFAMIRMPDRSYRGALPALTAEQTALRDSLQRDVKVLAGDIGQRSVFQFPKLRAAAAFIQTALTNSGYKVRSQDFLVMEKSCSNLEVEVKGRSLPGEIVVVGAHYDAVDGSPGANDNGSGVAALLALARQFSRLEASRTLRLVAFVNEEPPFFQTNSMGSWVYARQCHQRDEKIVAMLSLETLGYYTDAPKSQKYPFPLGMVYPSTGNFIAFVGNTASAKLVRQCISEFRRQASFPSEGAALPGNIPGVGWSDHWAFWQEGYPALMVTDTAPFRYPHYHFGSDTPDKVDYERFARVVDGLAKVIASLVNAE